MSAELSTVAVFKEIFGELSKFSQSVYKHLEKHEHGHIHTTSPAQHSKQPISTALPHTCIAGRSLLICAVPAPRPLSPIPVSSPRCSVFRSPCPVFVFLFVFCVCVVVCLRSLPPALLRCSVHRLSSASCEEEEASYCSSCSTRWPQASSVCLSSLRSRHSLHTTGGGPSQPGVRAG